MACPSAAGSMQLQRMRRRGRRPAPRASTSQQGAAPPAPSSPREALRARATQMSPNLFLARYKKIETAGNRLDPVAI